MAKETDAIKVEYLAELTRDKRKTENLTLQQLATEIKVSIATLSRLEQYATSKGRKRNVITPDMRTLSALTQWLGIPMELVVEGGNKSQSIDPVADLPLFVETHLRASKRIKPEHAELLGTTFRALYLKYANAADEDEDESDDTAKNDE